MVEGEKRLRKLFNDLAAAELHATAMVNNLSRGEARIVRLSGEQLLEYNRAALTKGRPRFCEWALKRLQKQRNYKALWRRNLVLDHLLHNLMKPYKPVDSDPRLEKTRTRK